jgi:hypothetical protein
VGDSLRSISKVRAIVGVWRVLPEGEVSVEGGVTADNSEYWAIATCKPL